MIFLMGGRGFYGSGFARALAQQGREFQIITRDNYSEFRGRRCDLFINANGNSSKLLARRSPLDDFDASVRSVRSSLVDFEYGSYVYLSSIDVYPDCSPGSPTAEATLLDPATQSPYGFHKALAEQCVRHTAKRWLIARLGGAVGPGLKKNAISDILSGGPLWLDPESRLQFLETEAAARLVLSLVDAQVTHETFNVCGRGTISLQEVQQQMGTSVAVQPGSPRMHCEVDLRALHARLDVPETRSTVLEFVRNFVVQNIDTPGVGTSFLPSGKGIETPIGVAP